MGPASKSRHSNAVRGALLIGIATGVLMAGTSASSERPDVSLAPNIAGLATAEPAPRSGGLSDGATWSYVSSNLSLGPPGYMPSGVAYDPASGDVFTAVLPNWVVVTSNTTDQTVARIAVGPLADYGVVYPVEGETFPVPILWDPYLGSIIVGSYSSDSLTLINGTSLLVVGNYSLPGAPAAVVLDSENGQLIVLAQFANSTLQTGVIYVLNGSNESLPLQHTVWTATGPFDPYTAAAVVDTVDQVLYFTVLPGCVVCTIDYYGSLYWVSLTTYQIQETGVCAGGTPLMAYDPVSDEVFLPHGAADCVNGAVGPGELVAVSGATQTANWSVSGGATDEMSALGYDPNVGQVVAASPDLVSFVNTTSRAVSSTTNDSVTCPVGPAFGPAQGTVYLGDQCGNQTFEIDASSGAARAATVSGLGPAAIAYDPSIDSLLVADEVGGAINVVAGSPPSVVSTTPAVLGADTVTYEPGFGRAVVTGWSGGVDEFNDSSHDVSPVSNLGSPTYSDQAAAWDPTDSDVYVGLLTDLNVGEVVVLSGSTGQVLANVSASLNYGGPDAVTFDPATGDILAGGIGANTILLLNSTDNSLAGSYNLSSNEADILSLADVPSLNSILVSTTAPGPSYFPGGLVELNASTGSLGVSRWTGDILYGLTLDPPTGAVFGAATTNDSIVEVNTTTLDSTYFAAGESPMALAYDPASGAIVSANYGSDSLTFISREFRYPLTFSEVGLPNGTVWSVSVNGTTINSENSSLTLLVPNGTYPYAAGAVTGFTLSGGSGVASVSGLATIISISYVRASPELYTLSFQESGLPTGVNWTVTLNGTSVTATGTTLNFSEPNGTYGFSIATGSAYRPGPGSGNVTVAGGSVNISVQFVSSSPTSLAPPHSTRLFLGLPGQEGYDLLAAIAAGTVLILVSSAMLWRRGGKNSPPTG